MDEASDSLNWKAMRQWGDEQDATAESLRDAVVLYDRSIYIGTGIEKPEVGAFRDKPSSLDLSVVGQALSLKSSALMAKPAISCSYLSATTAVR